MEFSDNLKLGVIDFEDILSNRNGMKFNNLNYKITHLGLVIWISAIS